VLKVLIVEDQHLISKSIKMGFEEHDIEADVADNGHMAKQIISNTVYNVIILDVMLPDTTGIELCQEFRKQGIKTPILFLSALDTVEEKIEGLTAGGDDYMVKPFSFQELLARVHVLNKRNQSDKLDQKFETYGDLTINTETKDVFRNGQNLNLTKKEFRLLEYFIKNPNKLLSKTELVENVWDIDFDTGTNVVEVYVNYLRNKLDKGFEHKYIVTKFGQGYIYTTT
jgi:two-component system, OmpR family, copper resistance phosphate regulon response regulator CusR